VSEFEKKLLEKIEKLQKENDKLKGINPNEIPTYQYSKIKYSQLRDLVTIKQKLNKTIFDHWFKNDISLNEDIENFLKDLIKENEGLIKSYNEEDLKMYFIAFLLKKINFKLIKEEIRGFYEEPLKYKAQNFIFSGTPDFVVSKGLTYSEKPYFFIQEFKKSRENSDPEPQLLAELISAVELNNWKTIKGAYIVGENWNFVILNKLEKEIYEYFVSETFNCTKIEDLKGIYKNLLFVKQEIIDMIKNKQ